MRVAVIGSRNLTISHETLSAHLPPETTVIISGGARGVDTCAREYARAKGIELVEIRPQYARYGSKSAPVIRNRQIIAQADLVLAFWDGESSGTSGVIARCREIGKECRVIRCD